MTRNELDKIKTIKALAIAIKSNSTNYFEKVLLKKILMEISEYDAYSVNIPDAALFYVDRMEETPAIMILKRDLKAIGEFKRDLTDLLN